MRGKRAKKYRKLMHQYEVNFGFREPYQVLLDSDILQESAQKKIDLVGRLRGVLGGEVKPMVTQCDMRHLYDAQPKDEDLILQAKTYERRRCGHHELETPLSSLECISECVDPKDNNTNKHRYVIATQNSKLRAQLRTIPGVPLVYVNKSVMILEPLAASTEDIREHDEKAKFKAGLKGRRGANTPQKRKREDENDISQEQEAESITRQSNGDGRPKKKRVKGPKAPNPLSVKKSKKHQVSDGQETTDAQPRPANPEPFVAGALEVSAGGGQETERRKRKRKHKPKGDGDTHAHEVLETAVS